MGSKHIPNEEVTLNEKRTKILKNNLLVQSWVNFKLQYLTIYNKLEFKNYVVTKVYEYTFQRFKQCLNPNFLEKVMVVLQNSVWAV